MFHYLKGTCTLIEKNNIALEVNDVGFKLLVSKPKEYVIGQKYTVYTHTVIKDDQHYLIGFSGLDERKLFLTLLDVKGIGPKTAINILSCCSPEMLLKAISSENIAYIKKFPGVSGKLASQIILDLKGKISLKNISSNKYDDVRLALKNLGFKSKVIEEVLFDIDMPNATEKEILAVALKKLRKM